MANKTSLLVIFAFFAVVYSQSYLSDYNGLIFHSMSSQTSDVEGRLVVGGNLDVQFYSVGHMLTQDCNRVDLAVGGNFNGDNFQVHKGKTTVAGTVTTTNWGSPCGAIVNAGLPFNIEDVFEEFISDSDAYGNEATNGEITFEFSDLKLVGTNSQINYFNVDGSILPDVRGYVIDIPAGSFAIVNFKGTELHFSNAQFFLSATTDKQKILYNFPQATKITAESVSFSGSILAPEATFLFEKGNVDGSIAVDSYHGSGELHNFPYLPPGTDCTSFDGCIQPCEKAITFPSYYLFSLFIHKDVTSSATDFEGRVAVGGDVTFNSVGVGSKLPVSNGDRDDLLVQGDLYYHDGEVFGGNILVEGNVDVERVGTPQGELIEGNVPFHFFLDFFGLTVISELLSFWPANGQDIISYSTLDLYGDNFFVNVFDVDYTTLQNARTIVFSVPKSSHVIINIDGAHTVNFENAGIVLNGLTPDRIVWNFYNTKNLVMSGIQIEGSILAPCTDVTFNNGNLVGAIFARSYSGSGEIHIASWIPLPVPCQPCEC